MLYTQELKNLKPISSSTKNKLDGAVEKFRNEIKTNDGDLKCLSIAFDKSDLKEIKEIGDYIKQHFKNILIMGIGGSSLGIKTLTSLLDETNIIVLESIDSNTVKKVFDNIDFNNTAFLTISKSGKTIECISQTLLVMKLFEEKIGKKEFKNNFFFLTEDKDSPLTQLAKTFNIRTISHDKSIGGRFSYLSNVGLLPSHIAGLNIEKIRNGAADTINYFLNEKENFIYQCIGSQIDLINESIEANVIMPYVDKLYFLNEWYRQLWAESLGKDKNGTIPVNAMGTVDQHSQLQLYMDGKKNKFYTFIYKNKDEDSLKIKDTFIEDFKYLENFTLDDIMNIEFESTIEVLNRRKLPIRVIKFKEINERSLSQLLAQFMLETILYGYAIGINPFGQPAVEERKILSREMMRNFNK